MRDALQRFLLAAAVLALSSAAAYAQGSLYAKIPFDYRASGKLFPAGQYVLQPLFSPLGGGVMRISTLDGSETALLVRRYAVDTEKWRDAELQFGCVAGKCSLEKIYAGGYGGWAVGTPTKGGAHALQASIRLERAPTD